MSKNFERDLMSLFQTPRDRKFGEDVYRALANVEWRNKEHPDIVYSCSWRFAGGLVAGFMCQGEDYIDYYCSGNEGFVSKEIEELLGKLGWEPI